MSRDPREGSELPSTPGGICPTYEAGVARSQKRTAESWGVGELESYLSNLLQESVGFPPVWKS